MEREWKNNQELRELYKDPLIMGEEKKSETWIIWGKKTKRKTYVQVMIILGLKLHGKLPTTEEYRGKWSPCVIEAKYTHRATNAQVSMQVEHLWRACLEY